MPLTADGARRLAAELARARTVVDPPQSVWLFDVKALGERRATLYGWRDGAPRRALVVTYDPPGDRVLWACEPFVRPRNE